MKESGQKPNRGFLFVTGCPRSGTTEIVNVLNRHPAVAIGMERFKFMIRDRFDDFQQSIFEPDNFVRTAAEDTNILPRSPAYKEHYAVLKSKFDAGLVRVVGEKLPFLFRHYESIEDRFRSPKWIIMHRSPYAVAASYCRRARDPEDKGWTEDRDHRLGIRHWIESYRLMKSMLEKLPDRVFVCDYGRFYSGDEDYLAGLLEFLDLAVIDEVGAYFRETTADWERRSRRGVELTAEEVEYVDKYLAREEGRVMSELPGMHEMPHR